MKNIKKMRKLIRNKKWVANKIEDIFEELRKWNSFKQFECSIFFRGYEIAQHNEAKYKKGIRKAQNRLTFLQSL